MAKLKAPLFSLGASGALGKTLVYFGWKGIDVVREYVVPANPKSDAQNAQRGWMIEAVEKVHLALADTAYPFLSIDKSAFSLLGSLQATPRTWFNTIVKQWIDQRVAEKNCAVISGGVITEESTQVTLEAHVTASVGGDPTDGDIYCGTSKTSMLKVTACDISELAAGKAVTGLTNGVKYFFQYRSNVPGAYIGVNSGIYTGTPHA